MLFVSISSKRVCAKPFIILFCFFCIDLAIALRQEVMLVFNVSLNVVQIKLIQDNIYWSLLDVAPFRLCNYLYKVLLLHRPTALPTTQLLSQIHVHSTMDLQTCGGERGYILPEAFWLFTIN